MIRSVAGVLSGSSITLPVGPVIVIESPADASHRKLEQIPFFAGSIVSVSGSQYTARLTTSDAVFPVMSSPYRDDAIEYRRTVFGFPGFFGFSPGGITPYDCPSMYGILPLCEMMMWHVSPVASGPTMRLQLTTLPVKGALFLYV